MTLSFISVSSYSIFDILVSKRVLKSSLREWISEVISILLRSTLSPSSFPRLLKPSSVTVMSFLNKSTALSSLSSVSPSPTTLLKPS
jgi:hypothetical protein